MTVTIFTGLSRYADPWHPVADTSAEIARVVAGLGSDVELRTDEHPEALADLDGVDLLIVNSGGGDPERPPVYDPAWQSSFDALAAHVAGGGGLLAVHNAATAFPEWPVWADIIGTGWDRGTSGHPEISLAVFEADPSAVDHPVFDGIAPLAGVTDRPAVVCHDERYWRLPLHEDITPLLGHETAGAWHVMGWARGERVVYDGLGHDGRSYASAHRRRYLANEIRWLLGNRLSTTTRTEGEL